MEENNQKSESAFREERILKFWKEKKIFSETLNQSKGRKEFIFYEGPPTANGKPGIHHLEARAFKDVIPRYKTMRGYHVRRKGGWDTHGLPVELQVEKALGLKSKKEIEEYGIAKFNQECKKSVWEYVDLWEKFTERIGFWVDQENPYVTYHNDYIESVWNVIKEVNKQKLLYKDYKVVPWCPRCETGLSSHELAQGYETVKDLSVYVKFRVISGNVAFGRSLSPSTDGALPLDSTVCETPSKSNISAGTYILAWTTTPWTLPGNVALAVGEDIDYVKIKKLASTQGGENEVLILAKNRLSAIEGEYKIIEEFKGKDLIGLEYEPLYPFTKNLIFGEEKLKLGNAYKVYSANFVTTEDGTGVVHTAVMYGQDDFVLGNEIGLPKHHLVGLDGKFLGGTNFLAGRFVRDEEVAVDIIKDLAGRGLLLKKEKYEHTYPHCWRCHTALIYYARDSWYIRMSALRDELVKENENINWEPAHIKEGRFGEWLREIKDWAISRERYWGTPLPVWQCNKCQKVEVIGSVEDLKSKTKKSGNKYFVMRHGGADSNLKGIISSRPENVDHLTENGKRQILNSIKELKDKKIDLIISSDFLRTKETAEIVKKELGISFDLIFDKRIRELDASSYEGKSWNVYPHFFEKGSAGAESLLEVKRRISEFLYDIEEKYQNRNILIVSHESAIRLSFATDYLDFNFKNLPEYRKKFPVFKNAEVRELSFVPVSHNENYELDLHKPYIDEVELVCSCGGNLTRTKEVMDVWLDSGTMPFSQDHYPFNKDIQYPADFIAEAIDQTRGWFYTLHAVGILMGKGKAFKNVICLGHVLDASGKKMSKSIGNVIDPWTMIEKYGVDTLRLWMYSVNQPGESKNFDEKTVLELHRQIFGLLYNVLTFYELFRNPKLETEEYKKSDDILDQWIIAKFEELSNLCTNKLDNYKLLEPARAIRDFIGDLSTWYLRRSRERIKKGDKKAKQTLYFVLKNLAKIMAPFAPFSAEDIWQKLETYQDEESVHLSTWPVSRKKMFRFFNKKDSKILEEMEETRKIVTLGLQARQAAKIPVRQPLASLKLKVESKKLKEKYLELIKDELNVKEIIFDEKIEGEVILNTEITLELKEEGQCREFIRAVQDIRKKEGLTPNDTISLSLETDNEGKKLIQRFENKIKEVILVSKIEFKENLGEEIKIGESVFKVKINK
jgi:isoleucyl-tRNA synthetase